MEGNIEYLYHYTNIETLALILKHHTFRFSSLDKMDDLQEQETGDIKNVGQFCYISSWTDDETENIPMWNMYTSISSGIRIRLKKMPFKVYENTPTELQEVTNTPVTDSSGGNYMKSIIPIADMFRKGYICPAAMSKDILFKVEYTAERDKLYPKLLTTNGDSFTIALGELGKYKNTHWAFQKEWRYILIFLPLNLNQPVEKSSSDAQMMGNKILLGLEKQPFDDFSYNHYVTRRNVGFEYLSLSALKKEWEQSGSLTAVTVFEDPIELMSYLALEKLGRVEKLSNVSHFLALNGSNTNVLNDFLKRHKEVKTVNVAIKGNYINNVFISKQLVRDAKKLCVTTINMTNDLLFEETCKVTFNGDGEIGIHGWNDLLKYIKGIKI